MKILLCHNYYRSSAPSGEDAVADNEIAMLKEYGHDVITYSKYNDDLDDRTFYRKLKIARDTIWSSSSYKELKVLLGADCPDIVHIHSHFPQISPSAYKACYDMGIPVIHTLHNFRSICPGALLLRDGNPCELCLHGSLLNSLKYRCYRDSIMATGTLTATIAFNRMLGSYTRYVSKYIALTKFAASRFIMGGIPENLISIKPNFLPGTPKPGNGSGGYAVYIGRLSVEKGVRTLCSAWKTVDYPLKIIGDGPLMDELSGLPPENLKNIEFCGYLGRAEILNIVRDASFQLVPSECYEGFPMVLLEAFACGTPVIGTDIGSIGEIIIEDETGLKFESGNADSLAKTVHEMLKDPARLKAMRHKCKQTFDSQYSKQISYNTLMQIYNQALEKKQ